MILNLIAPDESINMKKRAFYPDYEEWEPDMREKLLRYAGEKAMEYGYSL